MSDRNPLASLPRIDDLLARAGEMTEAHGRPMTTEALRRTVAEARAALRAGRDVDTDAQTLLESARADLAARRPGPPRPVLNATGVVVHTNLGRAPLSAPAREAMIDASGYCDLELDLGTGERGSRGARLAPLLADACGAQAGIAVNNAAGALVLSLAALAVGREVLVSRGELVEIGGSFRLPEIMAASGARLVEVGTTNRTRAEDYLDAGDDVAMILSVHPSNYRIEGFSEAPALGALAEVAARRGVPLAYDAGSGMLQTEAHRWLGDEPSIPGALAAGADVVIASGDKLLGGPQAGLLVGRSDLVARCRAHPLARALRLDKLRIAALVATLEAHLAERRSEIPVWAMLDASHDALLERAEHLARSLDGQVVQGMSVVGGGSAPGREMPGPVVRLDVAAPDEVARRLRTGAPALLARVEDGAVWLDPRTLAPSEDETVVSLVRIALA